LIEPGSCFAGTLLEIALAADRSYLRDDEDGANRIGLTAMNFGPLPMVNGLSRIAARFYQEEGPVAAVKARKGELLSAAEAMELGLVTAIPDDLDWADEVRIACEERASLSPDALTGLEANLRFGITETMNTRIFGRLSAWQNWIFIRPNAVGENGALKLFGSGKKAQFDWNRV
ncbi:benzoyl-CoA-dihydrodiol lyase, partial [Thauera aromatica]|nr:benzoyl-CoA-dihydrodiol lyase [Thauera aromatica]